MVPKKKPYHQLDHSADRAFEVKGKTLGKLFENAAIAIFSFKFNLDKVIPETSIRVEVTGIDREDMLVRWLNELLFISETREIVFSQFKVMEIGKKYLVGEAMGEPSNPQKHGSNIQVKAVTYHNVVIKKNRQGYKTVIVCDV